MDAGTLCGAIAEVCPVVSAIVGDPDERNTWSFVPDPSATQPQIDAGNNVIATIPVETFPPQTSAEFIMRFTDAEYLLLEQKKQADLAASDVSLIKVWDAVIGSASLDMNTSNAQTLKSTLVTDGILTQARADEIFSGGAGGLRKWP